MSDLRVRGVDRARATGRKEHRNEQITPPQVSGTCGILLGGGANTLRSAYPLQVIESVRCLSCGALYSKLAAGGTAATNPGCPDCGYLGWRSLNDEAMPLQSRFVADHPRSRFA